MPTPPVLLHVNYFETGYLETRETFESIFRKARALGADGLELRLNEGRFTGRAYEEALVAAQEKHPLRHLSFGTIVKLTSPDEGVRQASMDAWVRAVEFLAPRLPLTVLNVLTGRLEDPAASPHDCEKHGSHLRTEELFQTQVAGLREVLARTESLGVRLAMETHQGFLHDLAAPAAALVDAVDSPRLGVLFDYGNMIGFQPVPDLDEALRTLGRRTTYLHLKNSFLTGMRPPLRCGLGDGAINHRRYLEMVREQSGALPPLCIEAPRPGDREHFAVQDLAYVRRLLEDISDESSQDQAL